MPRGHSSGVTKAAPHALVPKIYSLGYKDNVMLLLSNLSEEAVCLKNGLLGA